jgi:hypothetical protein
MGRKRFVDLSITIEPGLPSDPPMMIPKVDYVTHEMGAEQMMEFFPGLTKDQLPGPWGPCSWPSAKGGSRGQSCGRCWWKRAM